MNESLDKLHSFQKQPEALRLADILDREWADYALTYDTALEASAELRRLHAVNQELLSALNAMLTHMGMDEEAWNKPTFDQARAAMWNAKATGGAV